MGSAEEAWEALRGHPVAHMLLGCQWGRMDLFGRSLRTAEDRRPCQERAVKIVVLHYRGEQVDVKACPRHLEALLDNSSPTPDGQ